MIRFYQYFYHNPLLGKESQLKTRSKTHLHPSFLSPSNIPSVSERSTFNFPSSS